MPSAVTRKTEEQGGRTDGLEVAGHQGALSTWPTPPALSGVATS